ncbi:MAG TPA: TIM barrel protein [Candidatus Limnocylindria bacterium]|nr:TIM barrel protein [Candidatus Limnocylindria bacterium]
MRNDELKGLAAAPISWGVCEVPGWGTQLEPDRVLDDARRLGFTAIEAGPPEFLATDIARARAQLDRAHLLLIGGFVAVVLHDPADRPASLAAVERQTERLRQLGAEVLVLAPALAHQGYDAPARLDRSAWRELFAGLDDVAAIAERGGLGLTVHPHFGTAIETADEIERFLEGCEIALCLDTGHAALGGADPADLAGRAGSRVRHVHLKDVDLTLAERVRRREISYIDGVKRGLFVPLGRGAARIDSVLAALEPRYRGWYVLEQDIALDAAALVDPAVSVRESLDYVRARV